MDPITAVAASGMRARMESLDLLANNVANASTGGYKADREFYSLYAAPEATDSGSTMPVIERRWTDLSQGAMLTTGSPLDVAISGKGFFSVNAPGGPLYTRNGNFRLSGDGTLVTSEGYAVRNAAGGSFTLSPTRSIEIGADGTVRQDGIVAGQLAIVDFTSTAGVAKQGSNYFRLSGPAPSAAAPGAGSVEQGKLEASNSGTADAAVRLIGILRQFEMLQKAVSLGSDMSKQAIEQVAKPGA